MFNAQEHDLKGINFLDLWESTMGQVGRYNNGLENLCLKYLSRERKESYAHK